MNKYEKPQYKCPICKFKGLYEPAYNEMGEGSYDICPCCGFEFGLDDYDFDSKEEAHEVWRKKWIEGGCACEYPKDMPKNWNPKEQLKELNIILDDDNKDL